MQAAGHLKSGNISETPHRKVSRWERRCFQKALDCLRETYSCEMPFIDCELTEGVIKMLTDECGAISKIDDIDMVVPGLSRSVKSDVMDIVKDIFDLA